MVNLKQMWALNGTALAVSVTDVERYLQIALLVISTLVTLVSSVKKMSNNKNQNSKDVKKE